MTADLELFLRGVGRFRRPAHVHDFDRASLRGVLWDPRTNEALCQCGARLSMNHLRVARKLIAMGRCR
jgi:hypothetical protein